MTQDLLLLLVQQAADSARAVADTSLIPFHQAVNDFTDFLLRYAIALAAVGALAMSLIELWKKIMDSKAKFHAKRVTAWVKESMEERAREQDERVPAVKNAKYTAALAELIQLCTGVTGARAITAANALDEKGGRLSSPSIRQANPAHAIFALDADRMLGAIQEASEVALMAPQKYTALFAFLTTGAEADDINSWHTQQTRFAELATKEELKGTDRDEVKKISDSLDRLRQVSKRKLDSFQLYTSDRWANYNQFFANIVGIVLMFGVFYRMRITHPEIAPSWLAILPLSAIGGILSPVAKDLVTSLRRVKSGE